MKTGLVQRTKSERGDGNSEELSYDDLFHIFRNRRRRFILHKLKYESQPVEISALVTQVAAWENEVSPEELTSKQRRRVYNAVSQTHLPALESAGIIDINRNSIELTENAEQIDIYLELVNTDDIPWAEYYILLTGVHAALSIVVWLNFGPFAGIPPVAVLAVLIIALLLSSAFHYHDQRAGRIGTQEKPPEINQK